MKKIIIIFFILLISNAVFAQEVTERITYTNGTTILMCEDNGNVDYCTEDDRQNAMASLRNPSISVAKNEKLKKQKIRAKRRFYYAQQDIQMGTNLINTIFDGARVITSSMGVNW